MICDLSMYVKNSFMTHDCSTIRNELKHPDIYDIKCKIRLHSQPSQLRKETIKILP